ncbi:putative nucleoprotein [Serpentovirinae sp. isolate L25]|uniref:Nucleoprotein n=1 Tax=Serpentovirinae sp. isolate L25 TaxID=3071293 RepID=A0AAE6TW11_9NIDO|nr:putative nucleoprotein [Serpentovirinae sp.]QFU19810.1 putative nucleoprotein [Serpentovirinae sp.]
MAALNPNAPAFVPQTTPFGPPIMFMPRRRPQPRRRQPLRRRRPQRRNNQNNNNPNSLLLAKSAQQQQGLAQQVSKLTTTVNKLTTQNTTIAPQLQTASHAAAPTLLVTPQSGSDVRLNSHPDALNYLYRHLVRVLRTGAGSIISGNGNILLRVEFPSNQVSHSEGQLRIQIAGESTTD